MLAGENREGPPAVNMPPAQEVAKGLQRVVMSFSSQLGREGEREKGWSLCCGPIHTFRGSQTSVCLLRKDEKEGGAVTGKLANGQCWLILSVPANFDHRQDLGTNLAPTSLVRSGSSLVWRGGSGGQSLPALVSSGWDM
jgi:hypothetical protein